MKGHFLLYGWVYPKAGPGGGRSSVFLEELKGTAEAAMSVLEAFLLKCHTLRSVKALESQGTITCYFKLGI